MCSRESCQRSEGLANPRRNPWPALPGTQLLVIREEQPQTWAAFPCEGGRLAKVWGPALFRQGGPKGDVAGGPGCRGPRLPRKEGTCWAPGPPSCSSGSARERGYCRAMAPALQRPVAGFALCPQDPLPLAKEQKAVWGGGCSIQAGRRRGGASPQPSQRDACGR